MSTEPGKIQRDFLEKLSLVENLASLDELRSHFLGKNGYITSLMQGIAALPIEQRKDYGAEVNRTKVAVEAALSEKKSLLEVEQLQLDMARENIDISLPPRCYAHGGAHPISQAIRDIEFIFAQMGFSRAEGPEIEDDWHNFTALNIPESHPARQMHDTFYFEGAENLLLRTHTTPVQIRHMQDKNPPARIISVGRVYRSDDDATHTPMFHQVDGFCIDKNINMAHMKYTIESFLQQFFQVESAPIRLRPSFFPFTEPSAEVDVRCDRSNKGSIKIGDGSDWLEILGCGMIHPNVLRSMGIDPDIYQGFAFGIGIERIAMLKYNIPDLRTLFGGNIWC